MKGVASTLLVIFYINAFAQEKYKKPEPLIDQIVTAEDFPSPIFNRDKTAYIKSYYEVNPSIQYVSRPQLKLAGLRFNPENYTSVSNYYIKRLSYVDINKNIEKPISFAPRSIIREVSWSPDGKKLALSIETTSCHQVWVVQIPSLAKMQLKNVCLNAVMGRGVDWIDSNQLLLKVRTKKQKSALIIEKLTPVGPVVFESAGKVSNNRTFSDLLKTPQDEELLARALESQHIIYNTLTQKTAYIGKPDYFAGFSYSPNRKNILVQTYKRPFSYVVPISLFAKKVEVSTANMIPIKLISDTPALENLPIEGVRTGPRGAGWVNSEPQTLVYVQALDGGDWNVKAEYRDELLMWSVASEKKDPVVMKKFKNRVTGFESVDLPNTFFVEEYERDKKWVTSHLMQLEEQTWKTKEIFNYNEDDDYNNPGSPIHKLNKYDESVVAVDKSSGISIYLAGQGASPEGDRPFLRKLNLENLKQEEVFRSKTGSYERFRFFIDKNNFSSFVTLYESSTEAPRYFIYTLTKGETKKKILYQNEDPYKILRQLKKELITYKRDDGILLSGTLYYPLNYEKGKKYPALVQAYPLEYTDAQTAGQVRGSNDRFIRPFGESVIYNALRGYFVLDDAQMPIVGHPETKNDTFVEQLKSNAKATIQALEKTDSVDIKRVGVIGHSYGAFMVAHLLTHTDYFATGIAKSGAYNRTLTPNGFQGERRPFWKAKSTYIKLSPFMDAEKVNEPLLLIHGMADNNSGTFTMQSERYFEALKGQGAVARLVLLPEESHGYDAVESTQHVLSEIFSWLDKYTQPRP